MIKKKMKTDKDKINTIIDLITAAQNSIHSAEQMLKSLGDKESKKPVSATPSKQGEATIIEGIFDGEKMLGNDNKEYPVPENYASKSKLVKGDTLKLTIGGDGSHLFKQILPVERKRIIGEVVDEGGYFKAISEGKSYKILNSSITFYKLIGGDKVALLIPAEEESDWAAVENKLLQSEDSSGTGENITLPKENPSESVTGKNVEPSILSNSDETEKAEPSAENSVVMPATPVQNEAETELISDILDRPSDKTKAEASLCKSLFSTAAQSLDI
ncbi:MAG: hypothetical protein M1355_03775 [Patescibacteria group bacterium]|nr:hypothetical protein [Patescibacteria group bacterium]